MSRWIFLLFFLIAIICEEFFIFDNLLHLKKPDLVENHGFTHLHIIYEGHLFKGEEDIPLQETIESVVEKLNQTKSNKVVIDIERWSTSTKNITLLEENIDRYITTVERFKKADLKNYFEFGYYSMVPTRNYWTPVINNTEDVKEWEEQNNRLGRLADHLDFIFPSIYTFYLNQEGWRTYAIANILEARKYGKKVYPYIWPQFHSSTALAGQYIDGDYWRMQLEVCKEFSDGFVIWGGYKDTWNASQSWWIATDEFMNSIKCNGDYPKNSCEGNGDCNVFSNSCDCDFGWKGETCSINLLERNTGISIVAGIFFSIFSVLLFSISLLFILFLVLFKKRKQEAKSDAVNT